MARQGLYVFQQKLHELKRDYFNAVGRLLESNWSDLLIDADTIDKMTDSNNELYCIIQPKCTHIADKKDYNTIRDECAKVWGNYVVFKIIREGEDKYRMFKWDKLDTMSYDTENEALIQKYKDFELKD